MGRHGVRGIDGAPHLWFRQAHEQRRRKEEEKGSICCFQLTPRTSSLEPFDSETMKGKWNGPGLALAEVEC